MMCVYYSCSNNKNQVKNASSSKQQVSIYHKIDFIKFIEARKNDSLDFREELLENKDFVNIFEHGKYYFDDFLSFLGTGKFNAMQVSICICAMQNLDLDHYVILCNLILSLRNQNKVSDGIVELTISPDFLHKRIIIDNYDNPNVIKLIQSIKNNKIISDKDLLNFLPNILSGKSSKELKEFDEESSSK